MLPRKCKKCRCYVAPHLDRCPRCNAKQPIVAAPVKPTKEDRDAERAERDAALPSIKAIHMQWVPSAGAIAAHKQTLDEVRRQMAKTDSVKLRNALRSQLRSIKQFLAKADGVSARHRWTTEIFHTKHASVTVFVSPKGRRYILASKDGPAHLIVIGRKKNRGLPAARLCLLEKSSLARAVRKEQHEEKVHSKRKKAKKERKIKKRATVKALVDE